MSDISSTFVSLKSSKVVKNPEGHESDCTALAKSRNGASSPGPRFSTKEPSPIIPAPAIRKPSLESPEQQRKRIAEEEEKVRSIAKAKADAEEKRQKEQYEKEEKAKAEEEQKRRKLQEEEDQSPALGQVAPLQVSANKWDRKSIAVTDPDLPSPSIVDRKVKSLLNKLTTETFDSISDQIIAWANKSEKEKDSRTLIQVINLVFKKATDDSEARWCEMYARLCRKMMERISPQVQDHWIKNPEGKPVAGGQLFRKYLLNRCQQDFERDWVAKEAVAAAAAAKALEDQAVKAANEKGKESHEIVLYSDEYYAARKAKRQGLGLINFIGELFKLQMLTERNMHECVKKLLGNVVNPEEVEIESLCTLLTTVGGILDTAKAHKHMDVYFWRMKELTKSGNVSSRMQFMLQVRY